MATRKAVPGSTSKDEVFHRISALLHTMRCIAQHEDQLCTLLHASKDSKGLTAGLHEELQELLERMPSHEYTDDMEAVRAMLPTRLIDLKRGSLAKKKKKKTASSRSSAKPTARVGRGRKA